MQNMQESTISASLKMTARNVNVFYGEKQAIKNVSIDIDTDNVTAFIGPSGCGKSTFLRTMNRMNDRVPGFERAGDVTLDGQVTFEDFQVLKAHFGQKGMWREQGDLNGDNVVDQKDLEIMAPNLKGLSPAQQKEVDALRGKP